MGSFVKAFKNSALVFLTAFGAAHAQTAVGGGTIGGNFQIDVQSYVKDSAIGTPDVPEKVLSNGFLNLIYQQENFQAGLRYESYLNPLLGFDRRYTGSGIPYRYATIFTDDHSLEATVGNFYEQFGNGLILRAYEERQLGYDNAFDGVRLRYQPTNGIRLIGLLGKQRSFFTLGPGIVRALDGEFDFNEFAPDFLPDIVRLRLGGSAVSKYQTDQDPIYKLPENVLALAGRTALGIGEWTLNGEYAYKYNDPSSTNRLSYNPGNTLFLSSTYAGTGFGLTAEFKRTDNMDFRSDRTAQVTNLQLNFLPPVTRQHTYRLPTLYPYATQPNGEIGYQLEGTYTFAPETMLGGDYGTTITANFSKVHSLDTTRIDEFRYDSEFLKFGEVLYFQDFNIDISKTWTPKFKTQLTYINFHYNKDIIEGVSGYGQVNSNIFVLDMTYKLSSKNAIRTEFQHLSTKQDMGNWAFAMAEYTISPHWFFTVFDEWNYGNPDAGKQFHYGTALVAYAFGGTRIQAGWGRQRAGILCVGGVCRLVPASNGAQLSVTSTF
ncbi:MAG TPA: DUF6029 family protein [Patescibacteria group bacterium]|nr:DUF6029 family protein [Patescibacteria group bacterium]